MTSEVEALRDEAEANLWILSEHLSIEELVELVGMDPDGFWRKGSQRHPGSEPQPFNGIDYRSRVSRTAGPDLHLADLVRRMLPVRDRLHALRGRADVHSVRLKIACFSDSDNVPFAIGLEQVRGIAELGF